MTPARLRRLPGRARAVVIVPCGAIEQHGSHLPVGTDTLLAAAWLERALPLLPRGAAWIAPAIEIGKSNEHAGYPGTLDCGAELLLAQCDAIAEQVAAWGFRTLAFVNAHGGNSAVLALAARAIHAHLGLRTALLSNWQKPDLHSARERDWGFHAGEFETSLLLALNAGAVDLASARDAYPVSSDNGSPLQPENAPATFAWITRDLSPSGVLGAPSQASAEKGRRWLDEGARELARRLLALRARR
jgi:creatinine amidohydrolase